MHVDLLDPICLYSTNIDQRCSKIGEYVSIEFASLAVPKSKFANQFDVELAQVNYSKTSPELGMDIYRPVGQTRSIGVAYFHGGGWQKGSRRDFGIQRCAALAAKGVLVASADYRLFPGSQIVESIQDAGEAVSFLLRHQLDLGISISRGVGVWGASAGGHLAAMASRAGLQDAIGAAVYFAGAISIQAMLQEAGDSPTSPVRTVFASVGQRERHTLDPLAQIYSGTPPTLLVHGDADQQIAHRHSFDYFEALSQFSVGRQLLVLGDAGHESDAFGSPGTIQAVADFFIEHLS